MNEVNEEKKPNKRGPKPIGDHVMSVAERGQRFREREKQREHDAAVRKEVQQKTPIHRSELEMFIVNSEVASLTPITNDEMSKLSPEQQDAQSSWELCLYFNENYTPTETLTDRLHKLICEEMMERYDFHNLQEVEDYIERQLADGKKQ